MSEAVDELSEWGPATDPHPMQTRTRTGLQEGRPKRRFEHYANYSSSDEQSEADRIHEDVRLPVREDADDVFLKNLYIDSDEERQGMEQQQGAPGDALYTDFAAAPAEWDQDASFNDQILDSSMPDFDDPLDSILR